VQEPLFQVNGPFIPLVLCSVNDGDCDAGKS